MSTAIFSNTPIWVWVLFVFLIKRGVAALHTRQTPLNRLFIIPLLFLSAGIYHLIGFNFYPTILIYIITLIISCIVRVSFLWRSPIEYNASAGLVTRPGSAFVLILILASFVFKFSMTYFMENDSMLLMNFTFQCLWGAGSGIATGLSWGGLLYVIYKIRGKTNTTLLKS